MVIKLDKSKYEQIQANQNRLKKYTILLVDDEELNLQTISSALNNEYHVLTASDGQKALALIQGLPSSESIDLIISDQRMPHLTGVEFLERTIPISPKSIRILLTGFTDIDVITGAINDGQIYKFLTKPLEPNDLRVTVKRALEAYELENQNAQLIKELQQLNANLEQKVKEQTSELNESLETVEHQNIQLQKTVTHLKDSENRYHRIVEMSPDGIIIYTDGSIAFINQSGINLLEASRQEEIVGQPFWSFVPENLQSQIAKYFEEIKSGTLPLPFETTLQGKQGNMLEVEIKLTSVVYNEQSSYQLVVRDIRERKEAARRKQEFFQNISHELRTPTDVIGRFTRFLKTGTRCDLPSTSQLQYLTIIDENAQRLFKLINNLLDLSRLQARPNQIELHPIGLHTEIQKVVRKLEGLFQPGVNFSSTLMASNPDVLGNRESLEQVLTNLISNAAKYTPSGSVQIQTKPEDQMIRVSVVDTGIGMNQTELEQVFDRFSRSEEVVSTMGSGLGLAITQTLIQQMRGTIGVTSEKGKGSIFWFSLRQVSQCNKPLFKDNWL